MQRVLAWERTQAQACLADVFGYHALQAGGSGVDALEHNRMPHRWHAGLEFEGPSPEPSLVFDSRAWPWPAESLDLVVLPHTLERSADPHACLREVERVLIPEGQVLIMGLNPWSLWGRQVRRSQRPDSGGQTLAWPVQPIAAHRLRDWLHLLGFEVQLQRSAGWTPTWRTEGWVQRWAWLEALGPRWMPFFGGLYLIVASKRMPGGRLLDGRAWRKVASRSAVPAPAASLEAPTVPASTPKVCLDVCCPPEPR